MIRWKYVIPRLIIVLTIGLTVYFGLNPLIRWSLIKAGQQATGAKVDIGFVRSSLTDGRVEIEGIQIADPGDPEKNLLEADHAVLNLSVNGLMRRKFIVEDGTLDGIRFGTERETSGALPESEQDGSGESSAVADKLAGILGPWLGHVRGRLEETAYEQSELVQVGDELSQRWPAEYESLRAEADGIKQKILGLRESIQLANDSPNPLRNIAYYQETLEQLPTVSSDIDELYRRIEQLAQQIPIDRQALLDAKTRDQEKLRSLAGVRDLDGESLSEIALGETSGQRFYQVSQWLNWTRDTIPNPKRDFIPRRMEGVDISFGDDQLPDLLIKHVRLSGTGDLDGERYQITGTLQGLTTEPKLYGAPMLLDLTAKGPRTLLVNAEFNRTSASPYDRYRIVCPDIQQGSQQIGDPGRIALAFDGGNSGFECNLVVQGEQIAGVIRTIHRDVEVSVDHLSNDLGGATVQNILSQSLSDIDSFELTLHLAGTIEDPDFRFESDLGPRIATQFRTSLNGEVDRRIESSLNRLDQLAQAQISGLEQQFQQQAQSIVGELQFGTDELNRFHTEVAERLSFGRIR